MTPLEFLQKELTKLRQSIFDLQQSPDVVDKFLAEQEIREDYLLYLIDEINMRCEV